MTEQETRLINLVLSNRNIKQSELARRMNLSPRKLRFLVHDIRTQGAFEIGRRKLYLIADNDGYAIEPLYTERFNRWVDRINSEAGSLIEILNTI